MTEEEAFWSWLNSQPHGVTLQDSWNAALEWARGQQEPVSKCAWSDLYNGVVLCSAGSEGTFDGRLYRNPAPSQPVRLTRYETAMIELKCADSNGNIDAEFYANEIQDAMLAKGAAQSAVVRQPTPPDAAETVRLVIAKLVDLSEQLSGLDADEAADTVNSIAIQIAGLEQYRAALAKHGGQP